MPYVPVSRYHEALQQYEIQPKDYHLLFSHQEFGGCKFDNSSISTTEDPWPEDYPLNISGHIHRRNLGYYHSDGFP